MPGNLVDVNAFTSPIVVPADGDAEAAASVIAGFQGLTNRSAFLAARVLGASTVGGVEYEIPYSPAAIATGWTAGSYLVQNTTAGPPIVTARIHLPSFGLKITGIRARYLPAAAHAAVPGSLPVLSLQSFALPLGATTIPSSTVIAQVFGTYANTTAYQQVVDISTSVGLPTTIAAPENAVYFLTFSGETGANSLVGLALLGLYASFSN